MHLRVPRPFSLRSQHCTHLSEIQKFSACGWRGSRSGRPLCQHFITKKAHFRGASSLPNSTQHTVYNAKIRKHVLLNFFFKKVLMVAKHYTFSLSEGLCLLVCQMLVGISWGKLLVLTLERKRGCHGSSISISSFAVMGEGGQSRVTPQQPVVGETTCLQDRDKEFHCCTCSPTGILGCSCVH